MSKKQVLALTSMVALCVLGLFIVLTLNALSFGSNMFSGFMTVVVGLTAVACLGVVLSPFAVMAWYPAEGLASLAPALPEPANPRPASGDGESEGFDEDDGFDEPDGELIDDEGFDDDYGDDESEEVFDDSGEFEDDDEEW